MADRETRSSPAARGRGRGRGGARGSGSPLRAQIADTPNPILNLGEGSPVLTPTMQRPSQSPSRSPSGRGVAADSNALPDPEVEITKTPFFIHPTVSMGPGIDGLYHNQATQVKMLQDIRKMIARLLPFDAAQAPRGSRAATGGRAPAVAYGGEIKELFDDTDSSQMCVDWVLAWTELSTQNKLAKIRSNKKLPEYAESTYLHFKDQVHLEWAMEPDDIEDETVKKIVVFLKSIENDDTMKEDFHIALAKAANPSPARSPQRSQVREGDNDDDGEDYENDEGESGSRRLRPARATAGRPTAETARERRIRRQAQEALGAELSTSGEESEGDEEEQEQQHRPPPPRMGALKRVVRDSDDEDDTQGSRASKRQQLHRPGGNSGE